MPSAPNTDDNGTDQPDTNPSSQPGTADSGDEASTAPDTGEAEADAAGPSKAATDTGDSEGEPFPPRGTLTLRALRWAGVVGAIALAAIALLLRRKLKDPSSAIPDKVSTLTWCMFFGGLMVWPFFNFREKRALS